ncbi:MULTISPECIES: helix-turn-helix transcriptional regulator [Comamonadaceae]|uniref:helix-turn-helix domain-containing protein n=1 Tax=Comamonadaceae TaxID=80864 RepID=UPI0025C0336B|nr:MULTISPECIES: helix-turn-helix transcriptional regulator [Comamonadaceae]MBU4281593.1 helix-turn-helix domain-containing protein [Gammaproteobacteria bacterium]MBW8465089.1 helix-turn-helix domain-containing protein [Acidovorax sp.]MCG2655769.1 helix-turn-helix domain-containing protein [Hydrogenophaga sp.]
MKYPPRSDVLLIFTELLRSARSDSGMSQIELGERLGVHQSVVSKVERGVRRLDVVELRAWLSALSVPLLDFVERLDRELASRESLGKAWKKPKNKKS